LQTYHHDPLITDLVINVSNPNSLVASAADGTVTIFDICQALDRLSTVMIGFDGGIAAL
jgi:hypothetical protein